MINPFPVIKPDVDDINRFIPLVSGGVPIKSFVCFIPGFNVTFRCLKSWLLPLTCTHLLCTFYLGFG
jgi:hypothetical protein